METVQPPVHPGEILLEDFLKPMGLSQNRLALDINIPAARVNQIVKGARGLSMDTAMRLSVYFGTSVDFWLNLQTRYELDLALAANKWEQVRSEVRGTWKERSAKA